MAWAILLLGTVLLLLAGERVAQEGLKFKRVQLQHPPSAPPPLASKNNFRSSAECAKLCTSHFRCTCSSYGYNKASRICQLFSETLQPNGSAGSPTDSAGFLYYAGNRNVQHRQTCSGPPDCKSALNFECRDSACQCVIGYHYLPCSDSCVPTCPSGYGDGYYKVFAKCMEGNNHQTDWSGLTEEQCWQWCRSDPQCRSFEHAADKCFLSYTTKLEQPGAWKECGGDNPMSYYQRDCS